MKKSILTVFVTFYALYSFSQQSFIGIQNNPRKGMLHAAMNPAELNHLHKKFELNLFAVGASVSNNALTFDDVIHGDDLLDMAFNRMDIPVNLRTEVQVLGPSFGFHVNKWAFGFMSQVIVKADMIGLHPEVGRVLNNSSSDNLFQASIASSNNQRVNASGWMELGLMAGREILNTEKHTLSAGGTFKFLIPAAYVNMGLNNFRGTITEGEGQTTLTNATGELNLSYPRGYGADDFFEVRGNNLNLQQISGTAVDFGLAHQFKRKGIARLSSGLSFRNVGRMNLGVDQINHSYRISVPEGESFRIDLLEGDIDEMEQQLIESGYFTRIGQNESSRVNLPTIMSAYTDVRLSKNFYLSIFGQVRMADDTDNVQIASQNLLSVTPRIVLGKLEIYSPWTQYEVSGLTGGLGLRLGGFFVGSQSVISGLVLNESYMADVHAGLSIGIGRMTPKHKKVIEQEPLLDNTQASNYFK